MTQYASVITGILHFHDFAISFLDFFDKLLSQATIYRRFKKLEYGVSDASNKSLQRRMGREVMDVLVEIIG